MSFKEMYVTTALHNVAVRMLPNPGGEIFFMTQVKKRNVGYADSIAALVVYRAFDFLALLIVFVLVVIPIVSSFGTNVQLSIVGGGMGIVAVVALLIVVSKKYKESEVVATKVVGRIPKIGKKVAEKVSMGIQAFQKYDNKTYIEVLALSICVWVSMLGAYLFFLWAAGIHVGIREVVLGGVVQVVANVVPNIAGIGVMEVGWVAGLSLAHVSRADAIIGAVVVDALTLVGTVIFGCVALFMKARMNTEVKA